MVAVSDTWHTVRLGAWLALALATAPAWAAEAPNPSPGPSAPALAPATAATSASAPASPSATPLDAITVKSQRLSVQTLIDRKVYTVAADVQSTFGALSDVLNDIPSVDVSPDGVVSLRGSTNVLILVDGKPSAQFAGASAGDAIQSFPAGDVERIEVLTTPPPEFKAEGTAGVINIVTRKHRDRGVTGSGAASVGNAWRTVESGNVNYRSDTLTTSATLGYRRVRKDRTLQSTLETQGAEGTATSTSLASTRDTISRKVPTARLKADYLPSDRNTLSGSVFWYERPSRRDDLQTSETYASLRSPIGASQNATMRHRVSGWEESLSYTRTLGQPDEAVSVDLSRSASANHEAYRDLATPPGTGGTIQLSSLERYGETDLGLKLTLPFSQVRSLKAGYDFEQDDYHFDDAGDDISPTTGMLEPDGDLADEFRYRLRIHAGYASLQDAIGHWSWLGGLRWEYAEPELWDLGRRASLEAYGKLYPSINVDYKLSDESTFSLGASRRVTHPDPGQLNPFIHREYAPNLEAGNPALSPQLTSSVEARYGFDANGLAAGLTGYYRVNHGSISQLIETLGNGETLTTQTNLTRDQDMGVEFNLSGRLANRFGYSLSGDAYRRQIAGNGFSFSTLRATEGVNGKLKLDYRPTRDGTAQVTLIRTDRVLTPQGYIAATNLVNAGYEQRLSDRVTAVATVSDLFNGQRFRSWAITPLFSEDYRINTRGRIVYVGFVYSFDASTGKPPELQYEK